MAYNPFTSLRKNQKYIMAGLVLFTMLVFVVSSGAGGADLFHQMGDWFTGRSGSSASTVAQIDGKNIDAQAVEQVRVSRRMANVYIHTIVNQAYGQILQSVSDQSSKLNPVAERAVKEFIELQGEVARLGRPVPAEVYLPLLSRSYTNLSNSLNLIEVGNDPNKKDQIVIIDNTRRLVARLMHRTERMRNAPGDSYFGGNPEKREDLLDFMIWQREADRLGVNYKPDQVQFEVQIEMLNQRLDADSWDKIYEGMRRNVPGFSPEALNAALAEEFRVRAAQAALSGEAAYTRTAPPIEATPAELYEWYRDVRTQIRAGLIEVPVASFLDQVKEQPADAELRKLYDAHKSDEPDPRFDRMGFKEPRKFKVEWFEAPFESEYYRKQAQALAPVFAAFQQFGGAAAAGECTPLGPLGAALAVQPGVAQAPIDAQHLRFTEDNRRFRDSLWPSPYPWLNDANAAKREEVATVVAAVANGAALPTAPLLSEVHLIAAEFARQRAKLAIAMVGAAQTGPFGVVAAIDYLQPIPPAGAMRDWLAERARDALARTLLISGDLGRALPEELAKRTKDQGASQALAYLNEWIQARGFRRGGMAQATDRFSAATDPGLASIRDLFLKSPQVVQAGGDPTGEVFAAELADGPYGRYGLKPELFQLQRLSDKSSVWVFWRSEDRDPRMVPYDQAKPLVEAAWRFDKARGLAKAKAESLEKEIAPLGHDVQKLRDFAKSVSPRELIEVGPIAKLNTVTNARAVMPTPSEYAEAEIPATQVKYPGNRGQGMAKGVIDLRTKEPGAVTVLHDQPRSNYYTAVLIAKDVPSLDGFRETYRNSVQRGTRHDPLFDIYRGERRNEFQRKLMEQLRADHKFEIVTPEKEQPVE